MDSSLVWPMSLKLCVTTQPLFVTAKIVGIYIPNCLRQAQNPRSRANLHVKGCYKLLGLPQKGILRERRRKLT